MYLPIDKGVLLLYFCHDKNKIINLNNLTMKNKVQLLFSMLLFQMVVVVLAAQQLEDFSRYKWEYDQQINAVLYRQYNEVSQWFDDAYQEYPTVPRGVLEAVAFQYTRFTPNIRLDTLEKDPSERPCVYSVMGLTLHGKGVFRENARLLAEMTPYLLDEILWQPGTSVKAYACAFARLQDKYALYGDSVEQYKPIFTELCELPLPDDGVDDFAMNSFLYMIYFFLDKEEYVACGAPPREIDFIGLFGDGYSRLTGERTEVPMTRSQRASLFVTDYPNAVPVPAASCNYTTGRGGTTISSVTIHYTQGTYAGAIAWFQNCSAKVSAHYVIRSVDGQVTQMVSEADKAWHVGVANSYTIGIEHEAYGDIYSYFTMNMYQSSANLVKNICSRRPNINPHRVFYRDTLDNGTVLNYGVHSLGGATACTQIRGHQHYPSQTHTDPGQYWNWNLYYKLINDNPVMTTSMAETGVFMDSGGLYGNYGDDERKLFHIHVPGADSIVLTFQSFNLEADYDFMWIYHGESLFSPLIGRWNTQSPGRVAASGEHLLVEFRSDCATTADGWHATWQAVTGNANQADDGDDDPDDDPGEDDDEIINDWEPDPSEPVTDNAMPQTIIQNDAAQWITGNFTAYFTDSDDKGLKWRFYQIMESDGSTWSAHHDQGFLCDNFDNVLNGTVWVNNSSGTWTVQGGELCQSNMALNYSGVAARYNGSAHTAYLFDFYLRFNGGEKCSFFFNCGNAPALTSLFSGYEVCFDRVNHTVSVYRLILGAKRLLKVNEQVYFQLGTAYLCRVVYDSSTGEIVVLRHANRLIRAVDNVLATTSNSYIGFVTSNASVGIDNLRVYGSRNATVPISVGSLNTCNIQQQAVNCISRTKLKSIVMDKAYKLSALVEKSLKVDYTPPAQVTGLTLNTVNVMLPDGSQEVSVSASWLPSSDMQSGVLRYYYHNSAMISSPSLAGWTNNGLLSTCNHCFSVQSDQMIVFSVVAENRAGLYSTPQTVKLAPSATNGKPTNMQMVNVALMSGKRLVINTEGLSGPTLKKYSLFDMAGRLLKEGEFSEDVHLDVRDLSGGVYLLRVTRGTELLKTEKVLIPR